MTLSDDNWWPAEDEQYLFRSPDIPTTRPLFQGDVYQGVPLPVFDQEPPTGRKSVEFVTQEAMVLPHPCQCYSGDTMRPQLAVIPVAPMERDPESKPTKRSAGVYRFRKDGTGMWRHFPLIGLHQTTVDYCADLATVQSIPSSWLKPESRVACLSLDGVALLHRKLLAFQTRRNITHTEIKAALLNQWNDALIWQAWHEAKESPLGYAEWKATPCSIPTLGSEMVKPEDFITGRHLELIQHLISE